MNCRHKFFLLNSYRLAGFLFCSRVFWLSGGWRCCRVVYLLSCEARELSVVWPFLLRALSLLSVGLTSGVCGFCSSAAGRRSLFPTLSLFHHITPDLRGVVRCTAPVAPLLRAHFLLPLTCLLKVASTQEKAPQAPPHGRAEAPLQSPGRDG